MYDLMDIEYLKSLTEKLMEFDKALDKKKQEWIPLKASLVDRNSAEWKDAVYAVEKYELSYWITSLARCVDHLER